MLANLTDMATNSLPVDHGVAESELLLAILIIAESSLQNRHKTLEF